METDVSLARARLGVIDLFPLRDEVFDGGMVHVRRSRVEVPRLGTLPRGNSPEGQELVGARHGARYTELGVGNRIDPEFKDGTGLSFASYGWTKKRSGTSDKFVRK